MKYVLPVFAVMIAVLPGTKMSAQLAPAAPAASETAPSTTAPTPVAKPPAASASQDETIELSPFVVDSSKDTGYRAENTLSGSRLNTSLRDTASSVSVFTEQFMEDLGINGIAQLVDYSVSAQVNNQDGGSAANANAILNGSTLTRGVDIRGIGANKAIDYFKSITPDDSYRIGRYDESRGPNGVLFGTGGAGGMINQSSILATTNKTSGKVSDEWNSGANAGHRFEFHLNQVIIPKKLAIAFAAVDQQFETWRKPSYFDKRRGFGALTFTPTDRVTIRMNVEDGYERQSQVAPYNLSDRVLAWLDRGSNVYARPTGATNVLSNAAPTTAQLRNGVVVNTGQSNAQFATNNVNRFIYIEPYNGRSGGYTNARRTWATGSYGNPNVLSANGEPGLNIPGVLPTDYAIFRINEPNFVPYDLNSGGPGMYRNTSFNNYSVSADWRVTDRLNLNIAHGHQYSYLINPYISGSQPELAGDANLNRSFYGYDTATGLNPSIHKDVVTAVTGNTNAMNTASTLVNTALNLNTTGAYAGQLYIDSTWGSGIHWASYDETRATLSYDLEPKQTWLGTHRIAAMLSRSKDADRYVDRSLGFVGMSAFYDSTASASDAAYLLTQRVYLDKSNPYSFYAADWRNAPKTMTLDNRTYNVDWIDSDAGPDNDYSTQKTTSRMLVMQSNFFSRRLITTFGYRTDYFDQFSYFITPDALNFNIPAVVLDTNNPRAVKNTNKGITRTQGVVYHVTPSFSLTGNWSTGMGFSTLRNKIASTKYNPNVPSDNIRFAPPPDGAGSDYGFTLDVLDNKLSIKVVYFNVNSNGQTGRVPASVITTPNRNVARAIGVPALLNFDVPANNASADTLALPIYDRFNSLTPAITGNSYNQVSSGYELTLTANPTPNWRMIASFGYTDRLREKSYDIDIIPWYGLKYDDSGHLLRQGVTVDGGGVYRVTDRSAYTTDGVIATWLNPAANPEVTTTAGTVNGATATVARRAFELVKNLNTDILENEQRWGLRPYRVSLFTAYEFKGALKGITLGSGYRWQSANYAGVDQNGNRLHGRVISQLDPMIRYSRKVKYGMLSFQINIRNVFNQDGIVPQRYPTFTDGVTTSAYPGYQVPDDPNGADRGEGMTRFDFYDPRTIRLTTTLSF